MDAPQPMLRRSRRDKLIFGVCGGLGDYFGVDPLLIRLAFVLISLAGGSGILAYLILAVVLPDAERTPLAGREGLRHNLQDLQATAGDLAGEMRAGLAAPSESLGRLTRGQQFGGLLLVGLGMIFLIMNLGWLSWFRWDVFWPVVLVALGASILIRHNQKG